MQLCKQDLLTKGDHGKNAGGICQLISHQIRGKRRDNGQHDFRHFIVVDKLQPKGARHTKAQANCWSSKRQPKQYPAE